MMVGRIVTYQLRIALITIISAKTCSVAIYTVTPKHIKNYYYYGIIIKKKDKKKDMNNY